MGLLERDDSLLVVFDVQPGFLERPWFSPEDVAASRAALGRAVWLTAFDGFPSSILISAWWTPAANLTPSIFLWASAASAFHMSESKKP